MLEAEPRRALQPFARKPGDLNRLRERLRTPCGTRSASCATAPGSIVLSALDDIEAELAATGVADDDRAFNLTWHDWLNLRSLTETSRVIALGAGPGSSRGAHFREDFPEPGELADLAFTVARQTAGRIEISESRSEFTIVSRRDAAPGSSRRRARRT